MKRTLLASILIANFLSLNAAQNESIALKKELERAKVKGDQAYQACLSECIQKGLGARGWPKDIKEVPDQMRNSWISSHADAQQECLHGSPGLMGRRFLKGVCGKVLRDFNQECAAVENKLREAWHCESQS